MSSQVRNRSRSNSTKRKPKGDVPKYPSLHFGNLPSMFYDLDLSKFIKKHGFNVLKAKVAQD